MLTTTTARITLNSLATSKDWSPSGGFSLFSAKNTSLSPLFCLSGGLAARLAWLFRVADGADDGDHAEHEREAGEKALMIVIKRKVGARLACVRVCLAYALILIIMLLLDYYNKSVISKSNFYKSFKNTPFLYIQYI